MTPTRVTTDTAACYPPALRAVLPTVAQRTSNCLHNGLEREHHQLQGRVRPMRWFKRVDGASNVCRGHAFIRNLKCGFSSLTAAVTPQLRLAGAWSVLTASL